MILKSPDILPGANALAMSRVKSCPAIVIEFEENAESSIQWLGGKYYPTQSIRFVASHKRDDLSDISRVCEI